MTISCLIELGEDVRQINFTGGERTVVLATQKFEISDVPTPRIIFEPKLNRMPNFKGICSSLSKRRILGLDGEFSITTEDFRIFGKAEERVLKEPDNDVSG